MKELNSTINTITVSLFLTIISIFPHTVTAAPTFQLATVCDLDKIDIQDYYVSEKFDGVRAYWDGKQLYSRQGHIYQAPKWFTQHLPATPLDGELWLARQKFEQLSSIVRQQKPDQRWHQVIYQVFDLPTQPGIFSQRYQALKKLQLPQYLHQVEQITFKHLDNLLQHLETIDAQGSEGLMLHHKNAHYRSGRNPLLCKLKTYSDNEAIVIAHTQGKGKYSGMTGALVVKNKNGLIFKIGTGLTDKMRAQPPKIGVTITYRYNGLTINGLPRFARFMRIK